MTRRSSSTTRSLGQPPALLVVVAGAVLVLTTVMVLLGALRTGVGTDEPIHVMRLRNLFDTGWYALDWDYGASSTSDVPGGPGSNVLVYGPVAMLLLHGWGVLWGTETWGQVGTTEGAYQLRHLGVALIGLTGVAATAALGRVLLRSWRWGLVAAAALAVMPVWTGNAMVNIKDVPVATGHTLVTLGLVLYLRRAEAPGGLRWARAGCLAGGLALALGTRPGMWPGLLVALALATIGVLVGLEGRRRALGTLAEAGLSCVVAAGVLVISYPNLFGSPSRALVGTSQGSARLLEGDDPDRWYLPRHLAEDLPSLVALFALTGLVLAVGSLAGSVARRRRSSGSPLRPDGDALLSARLLLVVAQAATMPLAAAAAGSDLYHGLRQVLFVLPALAVLAAFGVAWWWAVRARSRALAGPAVALSVAALLLPTVDQVTLQPYQTTYVNLASDLLHGRDRSADDLQSADNWRVSLPELIEPARLDHQLLCKVYETDTTVGTVPSTLAHPFANADDQYSTRRSVDCREEAHGPLAALGLPVRRSLPVRAFDAVFIGPVPENCTSTRSVTRWRHGFEVVVSTLARCRVVLAPLDREPVRADGPATGTARPGDPWLYAVDGWLQWPGRDRMTTPAGRAGLGFVNAEECAPNACTLVLSGTAPSDLVVRVNGVQVATTRRDSTIQMPVVAAPDHEVWVDLARRSDAPLDVRLAGLALVPTNGHDVDEPGGEPAR